MSYESIKKLRLIVGDPAKTKADAMILGLGERAKLEGEVARLDRASGGAIGTAFKSGDFKGDRNETIVLYPSRGPVPRIVLVGLGKPKELDSERIRQASATGVRRCRDLGAASVAAALYGQGTDVSAEDAAQAFAEGALLGTYRYTEYRTDTKKKSRTVRQLEVLVPSKAIHKAARPGFARGVAIAKGVNFARTLGAHPGNHATPTFLADEAKRISKEQDLKCTVFDSARMKREGMGALLAVAQGSSQPPKFILLEYKCGDPKAPTIAVVGKGLTFDSGGISIKPAAKMDEMKFDMCGGAAVLGIMSVIRDVKIPVNVIGAVPSTENLSGEDAYKPGDVLRSYSGKTIEVHNCDAEGRLILADALSYVAKKYKPAAMVDLATLTGAVLIALGRYGAGLLSTDDDLVTRLEESAKRTGERIWRLPLWEEMHDHLRSDYADLKNIGDAGAGAGTIVAGAFLSNFVESVPWAHIDIAGTAWGGPDRPYLPKGPSGYGVRLVLDMLRSWSA